MKRRGSGILLHVTSLPSPFGVGDLGPEAYRFIDFLAESGQSYWQVLPLSPTMPVHGNSPYASTSAFAGSTLLISPELLVQEGLLDANDLQSAPQFPEHPCKPRSRSRIQKSALGAGLCPVQGDRTARSVREFLRG